MQAIQTVTVGSGGAASIEFASIPDTFTDLKLVTSVRMNTTDFSTNNVLVEINGSSANLTTRRLLGNGSSALSFSGSLGYILEAPSSTATANTFNNGSAYFPNYAGSTNKSYSGDSVTENNATLAVQLLVAGLWNQTAAITSLTLKSETSVDFLEHSTATLYGILAGSDGTTTVTT